MANDLNYPDVLGYITDDTRLNVNVLQMAAALSPRVVRAGRPLEMYVLLQNASDAELEVIATLRVPDRDAKKQKERFVTKADRLRIGLPPAGVGLVILPVSTLPDTAPGAGYKIGMDVKMKPAKRGRPSRIRDSEGGTTFDPTTVPNEIQTRFEELKDLKWGIDSPTLRGATIETALTVMSGKVGSFANLEPSWTSLWTLKDLADARPLLKQLAPVIKERVLPKFTHQHAYPLILDATQTYFGKSKYPITDLEMKTIARLIYAPLAYAGLNPRKMVLSSNKHYNLVPYLEEGYLDDPKAALNLPHWFQEFLKLLNSDERMARNPVKGIVHLMFEDLVTDAMHMGLNQISTITGVDMGNKQERSQYVDFVLSHVKEGNLQLDLLYVPAVAGGVSVTDDTLGHGDRGADLAFDFLQMIGKRQPEVNDGNQVSYDIAYKMIEHFAEKFNAR